MNTNILENKFFQAVHSPKGSNSFFACGLEAGGGFGNVRKLTPKEDIFIGIHDKNGVKCLPFFAPPDDNWLKAFHSGKSTKDPNFVKAYDKNSVKRWYGSAIDRFEAENLTFEIATSQTGVPDPESAPYSDIKYHIAPLVPARMTIDNTNGTDDVDGLFIVGGFDGVRLLEDLTGGEMCGAVGTDGFGMAMKKYDGATSVVGNGPHEIFSKGNIERFYLAHHCGVVFKVKKGEKKTVDIILGFYKHWEGTTGQFKCDFLYKKYFNDIFDVFDYGLENSEKYWKDAKKEDEMLEKSNLNEYRKFLTAHAKRAYNTSMMILDDCGKPRYVVYEGSFMMMNTFDLTVDHLFYETRHMPWVVRNQLDSFADSYSYYDMLHEPGSGDNKYPGGISFSHDQGVWGNFMPKGTSSYERTRNHGCFSYMTQEQLCNYILCAGVYVANTNDTDWLNRRKAVISDCLTSMMNRDHYDPSKRDGVMDLESSKCDNEDEITTYDALDSSLAQSRKNMYIAGKCFASYLLLEMMFEKLGEKELASKAKAQAGLCANTIANAYDEKLGYIPAIIDGNCDTAIIPVIEGLIYPYACHIKDAPHDYKRLYDTLKKHFKNILKKGVCLFDDNGWKLTESNINSWISKIFLNQTVAEKVLGVDGDISSDKAHASWWTMGCKHCPAIDQVFEGTTNMDGFHYPRAVTCDLWQWD